MNVWQGKKVRLRGIELSDLDFFFNWNMETETQRNLDWIWFPQSSSSVEEWIKTISLKKGENDEYFFVIEDLEGNAVGTISTNSINKINGSFKYGIAIVDSERSKGYASEAILILLNYFFKELRYHKVNVEVYEFNDSSNNLHKKLGYKKEGQLREVKFTDGKYWDVIIYGMTRNEFFEKYKS